VEQRRTVKSLLHGSSPSKGTTPLPCGMSDYTGYTQKNCAVSKVKKKFISRLTRVQRTPSAAATVQVSHALPAGATWQVRLF